MGMLMGNLCLIKQLRVQSFVFINKLMGYKRVSSLADLKGNEWRSSEMEKRLPLVI